LTEEIDKQILAWFWKNKDKIIRALHQNDANWVYDTDKVIEEYEKIMGIYEPDD